MQNTAARVIRDEIYAWLFTSLGSSEFPDVSTSRMIAEPVNIGNVIAGMDYM